MNAASWDEDWSDSLEDYEYPDEDISDDDDDVELLPCPECGAEVYEEAEVCSYCGAYIIHSTTVWNHRSWWWIALGVLGTIAVIASLAIG